MENKSIERLNKLKQATILNFTDKIDYSNRLDLYDTLLENVFNGNFDDIFLTDNVDESNRKELLELARKNSSVCFFQGNPVYWADSVEGVYLSDVDFVTVKILDNFDFLIKLARDGGEEALKQLVRFQKTEFFEDKVIIDYLRNSFITDDILVDTIKSMSKRNGDYKDFSDEQKALLCLYPEGVIYKTKEDGNIEKIPVSKIISEVKISLLGEDRDDYHLGDSLKHMKMEDFEDIINKVYEDYKKESSTGKK